MFLLLLINRLSVDYMKNDGKGKKHVYRLIKIIVKLIIKGKFFEYPWK
jgi:hypothetical protein